ncbi:MAG: MBG domain-containing protein, partial [Thalassospira sp.]|uniref:MBG domain-containing protein n=1 Tax=Thalassospira sp. TaxID=1912094 RepID=UPI0032EC65DC
RDAGEAVGTYSINLSEGEGAENYDITTVSGTFTITKVPITVTAVAATKVYGDTDPTFTFNITSGALITGDELSGAITRVVGNNVGTYALESSLFNGNYDITFVSTDLTITKKALTATADDKTKNVGEANPELTITYEGFVLGDNASVLDAAPSINTDALLDSPAGVYDITLSEGSDNNYELTLVNGKFTVNAVNNPPTVANAITDKTEDEGFTSNTVDLTTVFADADSDALTYTASSSAEGVATVAVSGTILTYTEVAAGITTITVTANDGKGGTVTDEFTVTIIAAPVNNAPTVANAITDKTEDEGFANNTVDLSTVFADADSDVLTYTASSSTEGVATVALSGTTLTYTEVAVGITTITVTANDGKGGSVSDDFTVTINAAPVNNAPTVANAIADKSEDEGFTSNTVDLTTVFADADSDVLTYTASSITEGVATVAVSGTTLTYTEVSVGTTTITVTANDGKGGTVSDEFTLTINAAPVNNAPTLANAITDKTEDEGFTSNTVDLSNVFADADSDALTYTVISSTEGVATVAVSGTTLTYTEVAVGTTTITVTANDGKGGTVTDDFTLTINAAPVNNVPIVANAIADQTEIEGFRLLTIDLINVFTDVDEDALLFTAVSSNTSIASVSVSGFNLDISEEAIGTVTITVTADDGRGGIATDEFSLSILEAAVPQEAEIPQGFSPNGDGVNDMWQVPNIENFPNNTVTIFDRQGNKVYQAKGYNNADVSFEGLASSGA